MIDKDSKAQIWIETVIYTLIGIILLALVLTYATPKITQYKEKAIVEDSITLMQRFSDSIDQVAGKGPGTRLYAPTFTIKKGSLYIDDSKNTISLVVDDLSLLYSEDGIPINYGNVNITSTKGQNANLVAITYYSQEDLTTSGKKQFSASATPYRFMIEKTISSAGKAELSIQETSQ